MDNKHYQVKYYDEYGDIVAVRVTAANEQHAKIRFMRYLVTVTKSLKSKRKLNEHKHI